MYDTQSQRPLCCNATVISSVALALDSSKNPRVALYGRNDRCTSPPRIRVERRGR